MADETFQTTAPVVQQTPADQATEKAIDAHLSGNTEKAAVAFDRASVERRRQAAEPAGADPQWRDGSAPLAQMPDAPAVTSETDAAVIKLTDMGGAHADLVAGWGSDAPVNIEYARSAFRELAASDPGLIAAVDRSGLGDHPAILEHLAIHGRLSAGMMGNFPTRIIEPMTINRTGPTGASRSSGGGSAREEMDRIMAANPPGSEAYRQPAIQRRVQELSKQIAGTGNVIGRGGRTS